jgi:hypothetical protein
LLKDLIIRKDDVHTGHVLEQCQFACWIFPFLESLSPISSLWPIYWWQWGIQSQWGIPLSLC